MKNNYSLQSFTSQSSTSRGRGTAVASRPLSSESFLVSNLRGSVHLLGHHLFTLVNPLTQQGKDGGPFPRPPYPTFFAFPASSSTSTSTQLLELPNRHRRRLKGIHSRSDTNRTGAEGLSFYYPRLLYCLDQMLVVMSLSPHRVSSSKTVRPHAPCGARCIGHAVSTWSTVCSEVPHSQFGEGARPHLCMDKWNHPTPVCRRLSLTQAARGKPIPTGLAPVSSTKARSLEAFSQYSVFHL